MSDDCGDNWWQEPCPVEEEAPVDDNADMTGQEGDDNMEDDWEEEHEHVEGDDHDMDWDPSARSEDEIAWILDANPMAGQVAFAVIAWSTAVRHLLSWFAYSDLISYPSD